MPEYSQIQTCVKCNDTNFKDVITHFSRVLSELKLNNDYFKSKLTWEFSENGFMYTGGGAEDQEYAMGTTDLHIRPYVMGWSPDVIEGLDESWLEVSLLLWTEEIVENYSTGELKEAFRRLIWNMQKKFAEEFTETGTFLTNEATDGRPWEAIAARKFSELWSFDAAVIPQGLLEIFSHPDEELFYIKHIEDSLYIARKAVWQEEPWEL